jgi:hypothetical protein
MPDETLKISIDGDWTLKDLYQFPHTYYQVYSFVYSLRMQPSDIDEERREITFAALPWRGGYSAVNFYNYLETNIPPKDRPALVSMRYGSAGWIELSAVVGVALAIRLFVTNFVRAASQLHSLYNEIYRGLQERKLLRIEVKRRGLALEHEELKFVQDSARTLSQLMGFQNVDQINQLTGNPLSTLKIILSFYRRIRTLADYERNGKARL